MHKLYMQNYRYKCQDHKISFISPLASYLKEQTIEELQQRTYELDVISRGVICLIPLKRVEVPTKISDLLIIER